MFELKKDYEIVRKINMLEHEPEEMQLDKGRIDIIKFSDKYGIIDHTGTKILPVEYDNIFFDGCHIFILIKNGKMGLLEYHVYLDSRQATCRTIKRLVPCEYDYIDEQTQRLDNFHILYKSTKDGVKFQLYFPLENGLTEEFEEIKLLDEGYVELRKCDIRKVIDSEVGTLLTDDNRYSAVSAYGTNAGRVLYDSDENGNGRLFFEIFTEDMVDIENKVIEFEGELEVIFSSEGVLGSKDGLEAVAVAFKITDKNGETKTINSKAEYVD